MHPFGIFIKFNLRDVTLCVVFYNFTHTHTHTHTHTNTRTYIQPAVTSVNGHTILYYQAHVSYIIKF